MKRAMIWAGALVLVATAGACAPQPHTQDRMLSGTHGMQGAPKPGTMSNQLMPERSPNCSEAALATMPPEHRQACLNAPQALR